jgi:hypothetical protein
LEKSTNDDFNSGIPTRRVVTKSMLMDKRTMLSSLIVGTAVFLAFSSAASACDFVHQSIPQLFANSPVIFIGKVVESPWKQSPNGSSELTGHTVVRLSVERTFRGIVESVVAIPNVGDCTYAFLEGETYLVHANRIDDRTVITGYGFRPMPIGVAGEALKYIEATLANRPVGVLEISAPKMDITLRLQGSTGIAIRTEVQTGSYEIVAPAGEYTAWLEGRDGRILGDRKPVRLEQGKAVYLPLGPDR